MIRLLAILALAVSCQALEWVPAGTPCPRWYWLRGPLPNTGSMKPTLQGGEYLWCEPYVGQVLRVGDVVALETRNGPKLHRITATSKTAVWTTGDSCRISDGATAKSKVWYIARYAVRKN